MLNKYDQICNVTIIFYYFMACWNANISGKINTLNVYQHFCMSEKRGLGDSLDLLIQFQKTNFDKAKGIKQKVAVGLRGGGVHRHTYTHSTLPLLCKPSKNALHCKCHRTSRNRVILLKHRRKIPSRESSSWFWTKVNNKYYSHLNDQNVFKITPQKVYNMQTKKCRLQSLIKSVNCECFLSTYFSLTKYWQVYVLAKIGFKCLGKKL